MSVDLWKHKSVLLRHYTPERAAKLCQKKAEQGWQLAGCIRLTVRHDPVFERSELFAAQFFFQKRQRNKPAPPVAD